MDSKIGDYINKETIVGRIILDNKEISNEKLDAIQKAFVLQDKRISDNNYRVNINKIYDIAIRAMSSGIKDPNTAVHCINKIAVLLLPLAEINQYHLIQEKDEKRLVYTSYKFEEDIITYYLPLVNYGSEDLVIILAIIESLNLMLDSATFTNKEIIFEMLTYIKQKISPLLDTDLELKLFDKSLNNIEGFK